MTAGTASARSLRIVAAPGPTATGGPVTSLRRVLVPIAVHLAVRAVGVLVLSLLAALHGTDVAGRLSAWDGAWLLQIAAHGYQGVSNDLVDVFGQRSDTTTLGFFPGYPAVVAAVVALTGWTHLTAGLLVSLVSGAVGAVGLARLGELVPGGSRRAGLLLVALFAASPMAVVLSMTYTESLFCALAAWSLVGVLRRKWMVAGSCAAAAGLVSPTATALVLAVLAAALSAAVAGRDGIRPCVGGLLSASGLLGYLGSVAVRTGELGGWSRIQREGWGWSFDGGVSTTRYVGRVLTGSDQFFDVAVAGGLLVGAMLLAVGIRVRLPWPLLLYGGLCLAMVWGTDGLQQSKLRLLLPAFVLLIPAATAMANLRRGTAALAMGALALASAWFGAHSLTVWQSAI